MVFNEYILFSKEELLERDTVQSTFLIKKVNNVYGYIDIDKKYFNKKIKLNLVENIDFTVEILKKEKFSNKMRIKVSKEFIGKEVKVYKLYDKSYIREEKKRDKNIPSQFKFKFRKQNPRENDFDYRHAKQTAYYKTYPSEFKPLLKHCSLWNDFQYLFEDELYKSKNIDGYHSILFPKKRKSKYDFSKYYLTKRGKTRKKFEPVKRIYFEDEEDEFNELFEDD